MVLSQFNDLLSLLVFHDKCLKMNGDKSHTTSHSRSTDNDEDSSKTTVSQSQSPWIEEVAAVIADISSCVVTAILSDSLTSKDVQAPCAYINIETLESRKACVKLSAAGFSIVGNNFDDKSLEGDEAAIIFETPYSLLQILIKLLHYELPLAESLSALIIIFPTMDLDTSHHHASDNSRVEDSLDHGTHDVSVQTLEIKINRAKKRIQEEQRKRDENVEEYLKMAAVAQRNQLPQVKALFEKRNTKAATHIAGLQRKLERYQKELQTAEAESAKTSSPSKKSVGSPKGGQDCGIVGLGSEASGSSTASSHKASKGRLQHVGHGIKSVSGNLKDGISGISGTVISKPREIATFLLKQKFGSADNIVTQVSRESEVSGQNIVGQHHGSAHIPSEVGISILNTGSHGGGADGDDGGNAAGSECSESAQSSSLGQDMKNVSLVAHPADVALIIQQLADIRDEISNLREDLDSFKLQVTSDSSFVCQGLQEERFRAERLEEQVNDLTELHQAETGNLKQALADAEEKLSYQSEERLRDLTEMLDSCQAKIARLEQQQQQLVTIEGIENSAARALAVKLVNVGLTILQLLLLLVATMASALAPFLGSRIRLFASLVIGVTAFVVHRKWPQAQEWAIDAWSNLLDRL
ncbi:unnamed protein product [Allacma fusca]|uniref:GSKIP domain-containing protein n=1 Tax=Allacma fusca TaxID=39272 RepID=A0A8J2Q4J6_9HEXA|nr:unnamed protein product [Allacma fusca]